MPEDRFMRLMSVALLCLSGIAHSPSHATETSSITSLTPEDAEKLICTDDQCRPVTLTRRVTVWKCRTEERTKDIDGKVMHYTVHVPYSEEITHTYSVMQKGDLLSLDGLAEITPETAAVLARHRGFLHLNGLQDLSVGVARVLATEHKGVLQLDGLKDLSTDVAKILAMHQGSISLGGIETISHETADALCEHKGGITCAGLTRIDAATYQTLKLKRALPYSVTVDASSAATVTWSRTGHRTLSDCRDSLADQIGVRVIISKEVMEKYDLSPKKKMRTPPYKVMYEQDAIKWLASELSDGHAEALVGEFTEKGLEFRKAVKP